MRIVNCNDCDNKGKIYGLSQEGMCSHCIHADQYKRDLFYPKQGALPEYNNKLIEGLNAQERQMRINARRMARLEDEVMKGHAVELEGAADITREWIDNLKTR